MRVQFLNTIPLNSISGGNIYNKAVIEGLKHYNIEVDYHKIPSDKNYDATIVDSLAMESTNTDRINKKPIIALIHQIPGLKKQTINFYKNKASFIVTGQPTKDKIINEWSLDEEKVSIVRPGVLSNWKAKQTYNTTPKDVVIVANFVRGKGFEMLIEILNHLTHLDLKFKIIGNNTLDKPYSKSIIKALQQIPIAVELHFNLDRSQIYQQLITSDIFLSLSESETFGIAIFEALNLGLPTIAYKTGDFDIFNNYPNYYTVTNYNINAFTNIIENWFNSKTDYTKYCRHHNTVKRNWDTVNNEFINHLKNNILKC